MFETASVQSRGVTYTVARDLIHGWYFVRTKPGRGAANRVERFPLDHDTRHQRFFLSEEDQRYVGVDGLKALERLARELLKR